MAAQVSRPLNDDVVFGALRRLSLKYPFLHSSLSGAGYNVQFNPLQKIDFRDVYEVNTEVTERFQDSDKSASVLTSVLAHHNHKAGKPLWKLIYYKNINWFSFHCSHTISDGSSVVVYLKEFVENLNHAANSKAGDVLFSLENDMPLIEKDLPPPILEMANYKPGLISKCKAKAFKMASDFWPNFINKVDERRLNRSFVGCPPEPFSPDKFFQSDYIIDDKSPLNFSSPGFTNIDPKNLKVILNACRKHSVKLQTYLIMVYVHTMLKLYPELYAHKFLNTAVAISFRNVFGGFESHNTYLGDKGSFEDGFYVHLPAFCLPPGSYFSWDSCRKYHDALHKTVNSKSLVEGYYMACEGMTAENYMSNKFGLQKDTLFLGNTNLGRVNILDHSGTDKYHIEDILFVPMAGAFMGTHEMTAISTAKKGLNIGFIKVDPNVKDWNKFKEAFSHNLIALSATD
ncbi:hypothetical protein OXX79_002118 [Metschnikowia pulcherrima]